MLVVPGGRTMDFIQVAPGVHVHPETNVSVRKGLLAGLERWYVYSPVNDNRAVAVRLNREAAERFARLFVIVEVRKLVAEAYEEAMQSECPVWVLAIEGEEGYVAAESLEVALEITGAKRRDLDGEPYWISYAQAEELTDQIIHL